MISKLIPFFVFATGVFVVYRVKYPDKVKKELYGFFSSMMVAQIFSMGTMVMFYLSNIGMISINPESFGYISTIIAIMSQLIRIIGFGFIYRVLRVYSNLEGNNQDDVTN